MSLEALQALSPVVLPAATWSRLVEAHLTPPRHYHTLEHVLEVARHFVGQRWSAPQQVFLAVLFHDAVYRAGASDNEEQSAQLFEATCEPDPRVRQLILLTARHGHLAPGDVDDDAAHFLDCDLAILAAPPGRFDRYQRDIALEYQPVLGLEAYARGRQAFLQSLLARPRIFLSDDFHSRFDDAARANLRRALANPTA